MARLDSLARVRVWGRKFMRVLSSVVVFFACVLPVHGEIYECLDESGAKRFTNIAAEAKGCKPLNIGPIDPPPAPPATAPQRTPGKAPPTATPQSFPRVDRATQQARDTDRRRILEQELGMEQKLLDQAKQELATQQASATAAAREPERLQAYVNRVRLHENNVANLRRELSLLR
jgi:hypothetical protein